MSEEAAFLRAIQANPAETTAKLVYADWLDEHGESERAEYLRLSIRLDKGEGTDTEHRRLFDLRRRHRVWVDLTRTGLPTWDEVTAFTLGRLQGFLDGYAQVNSHESDISYDFDAALLPSSATIMGLAHFHYGEGCSPIYLTPFSDWESELRQVFREWLFRELHRLRSRANTWLAILSEDGREWLVTDALAHVRAVLTPTAGYRVHVSTTGGRYYALQWADVALEAPDRVLFLHFSFSD